MGLGMLDWVGGGVAPARCKPEAREMLSIVPRLFLDWCSTGARLVLDWCACSPAVFPTRFCSLFKQNRILPRGGQGLLSDGFWVRLRG